MPIVVDGWKWRPEPARQLRQLFSFDGFIGPSLRDAVNAFHKVGEGWKTLAMTPAMKEHQIVVVV